jgi:hypothetical protein
MNCNCCFSDWVCKCGTDLLINTRLTPGQTYYWQVIDKFNNVHQGSVTAALDGTITIPADDLPDGFLSAYQGRFKIKILSSPVCGGISIPLTAQYDCIEVEVKGGNSTKSSIGCETPCSAGTGESFMQNFTDEDEITINWAPYLDTIGNNPLIQVYHLIEGNTYQLVDVAIQQVRVNGVLQSIVVNNAGPATGYILITP